MADVTVSGASPDFLSHFGGIDDPRQTAKITCPLNEIFLLVVCAVISGAQDWVSIALYGQRKLDLLRRFLPFGDGTTSHDQLDTSKNTDFRASWRRVRTLIARLAGMEGKIGGI